jgi:hypothetical protein
MFGQTPHDLAVFVYSKLSNLPNRPSIKTLDEIFHTLYLTSMRTEEGTPITCSIAFVDPKKPDPDPPESIRDPRWTVTLFGKPVVYSTSQLTKLALAADPASSCLVVHPNKKNELYIWGLIDQQGGFQAMLNHENEGGWSPPGLLHVQILNPGHLLVMDGSELIAELNGDYLVEDSIDVFLNTAIQKKFLAGFKKNQNIISNVIKSEGYPSSIDFHAFAYEHDFKNDFEAYSYLQRLRTIRRILLRARNLGHGGAFLFTDVPSSSKLNIKYKYKYDRLPNLLRNQATAFAINHHSSQGIFECSEEESDTIPAGLHFDQVCSENNQSDANDALSGAIAHIASLSRVDGLVLLDYDLIVHGFGCEITVQGDGQCKAFRADHSSPTKGKPRKLDLLNFGTRHRSMVRYCSEDKGSVGFVVSHDGPVRAVSSTSNRLYFWDNVQLSMR